MKAPILRRLSPLLASLLLLCLLLLCMAGCGASGAERDAVTSVALSPDGKTLTVTASLTKDFLAGYRADHVYLIELPAYAATIGDISAAGETVEPLAAAAPAGELTFTLPAAEDGRSRLTSSFVLASLDKQGEAERYTALTAPHSLDNPTVTAKTDALPTPASLKGLAAADTTDALLTGAAHTVVNVDLSALMATERSADTLSYISGGVTAYLHTDMLADLDRKISLYTQNGVQVFLRITLSRKTFLADPDVPDRAGAYAVDMRRPEAAEAAEGILAFLADRYASPDPADFDGRDIPPISGLILGSGQNAQNLAAGVGGTLAEAAANYEKLLHVARISLAAHHAGARVYISLYGNRTAAALSAGGWDAPTYLNALRNRADSRYDGAGYEWHVALEVLPDSTRLWEEAPATDADHFTLRNFGLVADMLENSAYLLSDGTARRLLLTCPPLPASDGGEPTDRSRNEQAASYAFAYLSAVADGRVEALVYTHGGTVPLAGSTTPLATVFKKIDTTAAASLAGALSSLIGSEYERLLSATMGQSTPVTLLSGRAEAGVFDTAATPILTLTEGAASLARFAGSGRLAYTELYRTAQEELALRAVFDPDGKETAALSTTFTGAELSDVTTLLLDLNASADGGHIPVTLRLSRPAGKDGKGALLYEASAELATGVWQTLLADVGMFTEQLAEGDEITLTLYPAGAAELSLTAIGSADKLAEPGGASTALIVILIVIGVIAVGGVSVLLLSRAKNARGN